MSDQNFGHVFEPLKVKGRTALRNRLVFPAIVTGYATREGFVTRGLIDYHGARASHVGMDITEVTLIKEQGGVHSNHLGAYDDKLIPGLAKLAGAIKAKGAAAVLQLSDMGAKRARIEPVAPSRLAAGVLGPTEARELTRAEIKDFVIAFADAARRAREAGFDGVELHAAHMYLISQFLSRFTNRREDEYGGSIENRARFLLEIVDAVRERLREDSLVICRINGAEYYENGVTIEEAVEISKLLEKRGCDIISASCLVQTKTVPQEGHKMGWTTSVPLKGAEPGCYVWIAEAVKKAVTTPVIAVGKIWTLAFAEELLRQGKADLIAMGRQLIVDPDAPIKELRGRADEIKHCKEDLLCLSGVADRPMRCAVNKSLPPPGLAELG